MQNYEKAWNELKKALLSSEERYLSTDEVLNKMAAVEVTVYEEECVPLKVDMTMANLKREDELHGRKLFGNDSQ